MMREPAFNTIALMLTLYVAALVWGMQHVSDRYSSKLLMTFFRRIALWPLLALMFLLCTAGILLFQSIPATLHLPFWVGDSLSFVLLVIAVLVVIVAVFRMVGSLAKGTPIISWLRKRKDQIPTLVDILLNAIQHSDARLTREVLVVALRGRPENGQAMIDWLKDHHTLLSTNLLARELIGVILSSPLDTKAVDTYGDLLCITLAEALDKEEPDHARFVLDALCDTLKKSQPWTEAHMNLLSHIGFTLWKTGEYDAWIPRTARIPEQLKNLQSLFLHRVRSIWNHVLQLKDADTVNYFVLALCELIWEATSTKNSCETLLGRVYDILEDGYHEHVLNARTLQDLVNGLGQLRRELPDAENENTQTQIDSYMLASLAVLVELGEKEDTLHHTAGNGYMWHRMTKGKWSGIYKFRSEPDYYSWLSPKSYTAARHALGLPGLSRKQVSELIDREAATRPVEIEVELESVSGETSHPLLGSSPEDPILLKAHHSNGRGPDELR